MMPMLYFPTEHQYAVYAPFFVPVVVPIAGALASFASIVWRKRGEARAAAAAAKAKTE